MSRRLKAGRNPTLEMASRMETRGSQPRWTPIRSQSSFGATFRLLLHPTTPFV